MSKKRKRPNHTTPGASNKATGTHAGDRVWELGVFLDKSITPPAFLLRPWLRTGHVWLAYAPAGIGKTFFALNVAYAVASGGRFLEWTAPGPRPVLYVDGEMETWEMQARLRGIHEAAKRDGNGDPDAARLKLQGFAATYQDPGSPFPDLATEEGRRTLLRLARGKALVVIDNLTTTMRSGDENEAASWAPMQDTLVELRKTGTACLLIHHANKTGDQRGTSAKDVILNGKIKLDRPKDASPAGAAFVVTWEKARSLVGGDRVPIHAALTEDHAGVPAWEHVALDNGPHETLWRLVRSGEYATQKALADAMSVSGPRITQLKKEAEERGIFTLKDFDFYLSEARSRQSEFSLEFAGGD